MRANVSDERWLEVIRERDDRGHVRAALLDFDGTLSLVRQGWQDVMIPMMVEVLRGTPQAESEEQIGRTVKRFVTDLTGRQTVYQMIRLVEEVSKRGGTPRDPLEYKHDYLRRLQDRIADRIHGLETGERRPGEFLVPGAVELLEVLAGRGVVLYCASGTDEPYARHEADLLGLTRFFVGGVRGALDEYKKFSKRQVIRSILSQYALGGEELASIGDGFVEIEEGAAVGAITVGLASDEAGLLAPLSRGRPGSPDAIGTGPRGPGGGVDEWKRERLIAAGADVIIPDFRRVDRLVGYLFGE